MRTVEQYMTLAPTAVSPDRPISEARELMREIGVHHLPVLAGKRLVGLVTEDDLHAFEDAPELQRHLLRVESVMVPMPCAVAHDASLATVAREMLTFRSSAAVVMNDADVVGVFTLTDALRALADVLEGSQPTGRRMPEARRGTGSREVAP